MSYNRFTFEGNDMFSVLYVLRVQNTPITLSLFYSPTSHRMRLKYTGNGGTSILFFHTYCLYG